jgi:hypothetical protein
VRTLAMATSLALVVVSAFSFLGRPLPLRAQAPGLVRIPFTYSIRVPSSDPVFIATVPAGYIVRVTGVQEVDGSTCGRATIVEIATNSPRGWGGSSTCGGAPFVVPPEPGIVFLGGESVGIRSTDSPRQYAVFGWIEQVQ